MALFFCTAFREDGNLVTSPRRIARQYLQASAPPPISPDLAQSRPISPPVTTRSPQSWFWIDLAANLPLWSISTILSGTLPTLEPSGACLPGMGWQHWMRFGGVNHLLRLTRVQRVLEGLSSGFVANVTAKVPPPPPPSSAPRCRWPLPISPSVD